MTRSLGHFSRSGFNIVLVTIMASHGPETKHSSFLITSSGVAKGGVQGGHTPPPPPHPVGRKVKKKRGGEI